MKTKHRRLIVVAILVGLFILLVLTRGQVDKWYVGGQSFERRHVRSYAIPLFEITLVSWTMEENNSVLAEYLRSNNLVPLTPSLDWILYRENMWWIMGGVNRDLTRLFSQNVEDFCSRNDDVVRYFWARFVEKWNSHPPAWVLDRKRSIICQMWLRAKGIHGWWEWKSVEECEVAMSEFEEMEKGELQKAEAAFEMIERNGRNLD